MTYSSSQTTSAATFAIGARTDRGMQRSGNEDAFGVVDLAASGLSGVVEAAFVVADGMGGLAAGDMASSETTRIVHDTLAEQLGRAGSDPETALRLAVRRANDRVFAMAQEAARAIADAKKKEAGEDAPTERGGAAAAQPPGIVMGTTVVAGVVQQGTLYLAHVGDSRAYLFRGGRLERLTRDHSFVEERVMAGDMTEAEARSSRFRNMITRAIGIDAEAVPDVRREPLQPGDMVLVCSDGLTTMLEDPEIEQVLNGTPALRASVDKIAQILIDAANRKGGADNITVALVRPATGFDVSMEPPATFGGAALTRLPDNPAAVPAYSGPSAAPATATLGGETFAAPAAESSATGSAGGGYDYDTPAAQGRRGRRKKRESSALAPLVATFALIGLAAVILAGAVTASDTLRKQIARSLSQPKAGEKDTPALPYRGDYARLTYDKPERFSFILARGDLLEYVPGKGLYFVRASTGTLAVLSPQGAALGSIATLPIAPPPATPIPPSRTFIATDPQGNVYISYTQKKVIVKRSATGQELLTIKGFERPEALTVDEWGHIYVIDYDSIKILRARSSSDSSSSGGDKKKTPAAASSGGSPSAAATAR